MLNGWQLLTEHEEALILKGIQDGRAYGGPYHLTLFPTDRCNLDCFFCYTETLREVALELDWGVLRRALLDGVGMGLRGISFGGGGEPFIYKNLNGIMDIAAEHDLKVDSVKTNGTALTQALADRLVERDLNRLTISLNETTPETYAQMNQCSPRLFERAMAGARAVVDAKNRLQKRSEIEVQVFAWKGNYQRLPEMVETALSTGADYVFISTLDNQPADVHMSAEQKEEFKEILRDVIGRWPASLRLQLAAEGLQQFASEEQAKVSPESIALPDMVPGEDRIEYCYMGWNSPVIAANGQVYPCCHYAMNDHRSLGDLHKQSLEQVWHGERAQQYRQEMRHLLLTSANPKLLPRGACFIDKLCMNRVSCAFNFYLASPSFYKAVHSWAESGPRARYTAAQQVQAKARGAARFAKRALASLTSGPKE
jgi:radical SAM protein with 4Fe4S-binding SPASM domain